MPNNDIPDQENSEDSKNLEQLKAIESLLFKFEVFKNLTLEEIRIVARKAKLLTFKIGSSLSQSQYIPSNALLILEGEARLLGSIDKSNFTICKLGSGSIEIRFRVVRN